ncbi:MAG: VanZ family protein [Comamonadaceae bacterium]|nr:VanZ family protein [Comamonadaceae bacterium]
MSHRTNIGVALVLLAAAGAASAQVQACNGATSRVPLAAVEPAVMGKTMCASRGAERWQEIHRGGGVLVDYKKGPNDPVDPSTTVGTWSVVTGPAGGGLLRHDYGGGQAYDWALCQDAGGRVVSLVSANGARPDSGAPRRRRGRLRRQLTGQAAAAPAARAGRTPTQRMAERSVLIAAWAAYLVFVVYGSLVPLDYVALAPGEALARFARIPLLDLGVESRADWIANGVLYAPLGALSAGLARRARLGSAAPWLAFAFCAALAVGVEFAQLFFPQRTVSQNDLLAEFVGAGIGVALSPLAAAALARLQAGGRLGIAAWGPRLLELYALAWLALALFPYDLLLSAPELAAKLRSDAWGWLLAGETAAGSAG